MCLQVGEQGEYGVGVETSSMYYPGCTYCHCLLFSVVCIVSCACRLVSSMPYLKGESPSLLEANVPKITQAYITSRCGTLVCFWMLSQTLLTLRMILPHEPVGSFPGRSVYPGHVSEVKGLCVWRRRWGFVVCQRAAV
jgi:hypothetical protein